MKKIIFLLSVIVFFNNCSSNSKPAGEHGSSIGSPAPGTDTEKAISTLRAFYLLFYGSDSVIDDNRLLKRYVSERIIRRIDSLRSDEENLVLDYDPFIKGQDYDGNSIKQTLKIEPLEKENVYRVSFSQFGGKDEERTHVDVRLQKDENGNFVIYSILDDEYLNFGDSKPNKPDTGNYAELMKNNASTPEKVTNNLIFVKGADGKLIVNTGILNYIQENTTATNNAYAVSLSNYVTGLIIGFYDENDKSRTEEELFKIIAYASNTTDPLFKKYWKSNPGKWDNGKSGYILGFCNVAYHDKIWSRLLDNFKKNNYYNLPYLEDMVWYGSDFDKTGAP